MTMAKRYKQIVGGFILMMLTMASSAADKNKDKYDTKSNYNGLAVAIDRELPASPGNKVRRTHEAWVRISYVVTPDGRAIDPIVVDSSGGANFENEVRKVTERWRFEPTVSGAELPYNIADTRFTVIGRGKGTTRKFARHARHIMTALQRENAELARRQANTAVDDGGWSLYESTILWLMVGRIEGAEGNDLGQLEMYRRGLAVSDSRSLRSNARIDLLEKIFELESRLGHYAAALATLETLRGIRGNDKAVERLEARADEISKILAHSEIVTAKATVALPCNCDEGVALWEYKPVRRTFSFANLVGNVERFEARCEHQRVSGTVDTERKWSLEKDWGNCQVFVFGDDGASFDFLGHLPSGEETDETDRTVLMGSLSEERTRHSLY